MRCADWAERSSRWAGVRSETIDVRGTGVHLLRARAAPEAPADAPTQLLIHPMASGAVFWLDVIRPLTAYGPVLAPDLPGALFGHTPAAHRSAARAEPSAQFLRDLTAALDLDRLLPHGWSFGGLVALLFAELEPARISRLVLTDPTLPGPLRPVERLVWQTLGRAALFVGPAVLGGLVGAFGPALIDWKRQRAEQRDRPAGGLGIAGGDMSRCSPELLALVSDQLAELRTRPHRLRAGLTAFAAAVSAMYVDRRPADEAVDRLGVPTLLLWGDRDPFIERPVIERLTARRPDWAVHVFETVGHLPPWEVPDAYVRVFGQWLGRSTS
ncbi:alpha/beta hydrolase [Nocardia sp. CDC159]|uniref:Alpha/beta hydrolase n=1 Tax=Nocardia pulmonis TaxID=2951408 RepID=A0A9X2E435_9NOCA|nr:MULTISPECIES: alpha/beta fold hydrolase [Nocardia]MCM6772713.1 alpha/beta hydrolase [Nocardia pulmonis]MCM6785984.1 alpha/beta hydrolase [Nocardia sp. CDC159]